VAKSGRLAARSLAQLERLLHHLNAQRHAVIAEIKTAAAHLTLGSAAPMAEHSLASRVPRRRHPTRRPADSENRPRRRRMSAAARAKLAASARRRWAAAKKAGKNRLG
jgi:hypothetical protein